MAFELLRNLQYGSGSDCGQNLNRYPSRILPISFIDEFDDIQNEVLGVDICVTDLKGGKESEDSIPTIEFEPPRLGKGVIVCDSRRKLPEPAAYFSGAHSFVMSYLYLTHVEFYQNCHLPRRATEILRDYLREQLTLKPGAEEKKRGGGKKLIQLLMAKGEEGLDTDPSKNPYFSTLYDHLLKKDETIVIIRSSETGYYSRTLPTKLPKFTLDPEKANKTCYILLELPNGRFSPYGKTYTT